MAPVLSDSEPARGGRSGLALSGRDERRLPRRERRLGNKVALKLLAEELADDESFRERFVRESRTAATLNHPNIVTIYDAGDWDGVLYIAMRWVEEDLKAHLRREGPLAPDHALAVAAQVGSALDAAHARGLLHRDVKPANILLEPGEPGAPPIAYLADFGLTKHLEFRSGITASGQFVGTIDYMSPEQIEGREVDSRTDIYSLGCVVFESLAGGTPYQRETDVAVLWAHMQDDPPPLTELRPDLPPEIDGVLAKAMAKSPEDRYANCRELVADLRQVLGTAAVETYAGRTVADSEGPVVAPTVAAKPPAGKAKRPRRWGTAIAWAAVILPAGLAAGFGTHALFFKPDPQVIGPRDREPTLPEELLRLSVPFNLKCSTTDPPTPDFTAAFVCAKPDPRVLRVLYYKPVSGSRMGPQIQDRAEGFGLNAEGDQLSPEGSCATPPAIHEWRHRRNVGHRWLRPGETEGHGRVLCYRGTRWAAMEWTDRDADVYSVAYGRDLIKLRQWWETKGGPRLGD